MEELLPFEKTSRNLLVKKESNTSGEFGCFPEQRNLSELIKYGVICINKPQGPTSHQVADYVKKMLNIKSIFFT